MSEPRFAPGAVRLCGVAAQVLLWRPGEFWAATPAELVAALAPLVQPSSPLGRTDLNRMMERDHA